MVVNTKIWRDFENYIKDKYGSVSSAQTTLHHYEQILSAEIAETADTSKSS